MRQETVENTTVQKCTLNGNKPVRQGHINLAHAMSVHHWIRCILTVCTVQISQV